MFARRAVSPVVSTIILVGIGLIVALGTSAYFRETAFSYVKAEEIEFPYIYCTQNTGVANTRWKIVFYVANRGTQSEQLTKVFVNGRGVDVYGLNQGDTLASGSLTGTSFPVNGINLIPGEGVEFYVWVGDLLFSSGTNLEISMSSVNNITQSLSIKLC